MTVSKTIKQFLGLRQDPYGAVNLEWGEAASMRNFRITEGYHLQIRPGTQTVLDLKELSESGTEEPCPVRGMFYGKVGEANCFLVAQGGHVWNIHPDTFQTEDLGTLEDQDTFFFPFGGKVYLLNGAEYLSWSGTGTLQTVAGYVPLIAVSTPPGGGGTLLEALNLLTGAKRQQFSPDGTEATFQLGETNIDSVDDVKTLDGSTLSDYTTDLEQGTVTFSQVPEQGVNTIEIQWTKGTGEREQVEEMRFAECFNGASDTRVFLYGDGTNEALYSGLTEEGVPTAEYFPALSVLAVDRENTPLTGMIRHGERLLAFKPDGAFAIDYDTLTLEDGTLISAFYVNTIHRELGNEAPGQVRLLGNWPYTLTGHSIYRWVPTDHVRDERNALRISQRIEATLKDFDFQKVRVFDDSETQEYYLFCGDQCLVYHYGLDVWYLYDSLSVSGALRVGENLYFGTEDGRILLVSRQYRSDDGSEIHAIWESGPMDFGAGNRRFHLLPITVSMQPETAARVTITMRSNRRGMYRSRVVAYSYCNFLHVDFRHFSFRTNQRPQKQRVRIPVRSAVYDQLVVESRSASATATLLEVQLEAVLGHILH